jgi:hypothetical protein
MKLVHHNAGSKSVIRGVVGAIVGYVTLALTSTSVSGAAPLSRPRDLRPL